MEFKALTLTFVAHASEVEDAELGRRIVAATAVFSAISADQGETRLLYVDLSTAVSPSLVRQGLRNG